MNKQREKRNYFWEAASEAASLIIEGYRLIAQFKDIRDGEVKLFFRHNRNGNSIKIHVTHRGYKIFKNAELVKSEPV